MGKRESWGSPRLGTADVNSCPLIGPGVTLCNPENPCRGREKVSLLFHHEAFYRPMPPSSPAAKACRVPCHAAISEQSGAMAKADSSIALQISPDLFHERAAMARGARIVAGVDEAGRGPLAGPVVVSAVILDHANVPDGLNDSKKLTEKRREELFLQIMASATVSIVTAPPSIIARLNIRGATLWAMRLAVLSLAIKPDHVLIDGRDIPPHLPIPGEAVIGGDGRSVSIAAASIVAKVSRDRMCQVMHEDAPHFGFASHKGYGAAKHLQALTASGPCRHHREDFAPVAAARLLFPAR